jgi:hypothetical protein
MINQVEYIKNYQLKIFFNDGVIRNIDLFAFLNNSTHPLIKKYLNIELFKQFKIEDGILCWGDNEFDLNPESIYKGEFDIII